MLHDKKAQGGRITVIKVPGLGCWRADTIRWRACAPCWPGGLKMKNTYGDCLSLTLFGESHGRGHRGRAGRDGRRRAGGRASGCRLHGPPPGPRGRPVHRPGGGGRGAGAVGRGPGTHHRHPHRPDDREPEHPQRRLCRHGFPAAAGHADYTAFARYGGFQDARGGGALFGAGSQPAWWRGAPSSSRRWSGRGCASPPTSPSAPG